MIPIKRYEISESVEAMASALFDIPYNSYDGGVEVVELQKALGRLRERMQVIEDRMTISIANEVDDKGKLKFSNQSIRDAEMRLRLLKDVDYQELKLKVEDISVDVEKMKNQGKAYSDIFKTIQNEVYFRREIQRLDNVKEIQKNKNIGVKFEE